MRWEAPKFVASLDLCKSSLHVPLRNETKKFWAFITQFDVPQCNKLLPVLSSSRNYALWFQKMMNGVFKPNLGIFCNIYIDDILVSSRSEHSEHLAIVLQALRNANIKINEKKSEFFHSSVVFPERVFDEPTNSTKEKSVQSTTKITKPHDIHWLSQSLLGTRRLLK